MSDVSVVALVAIVAAMAVFIFAIVHRAHVAARIRALGTGVDVTTSPPEAREISQSRGRGPRRVAPATRRRQDSR
jgi:hypothetical protein